MKHPSYIGLGFSVCATNKCLNWTISKLSVSIVLNYKIAQTLDALDRQTKVLYDSNTWTLTPVIVISQ